VNRRAFPDLSRADALIAERGCSLGRPLHLLEETTSTNDEAKHAARAGAPHGSTWVAETQTAGRGRQGRTWLSTRGENLLFSVLFRLPCPAARLPLLSLAAGVAVCEAARSFAPTADVRLKWPNDVVVVRTERDGLALEKLAGILVETSMAGGKVDGVVIGIGLNVLARDFAPELAGRATSLARIASSPLDRAVVLAAVLGALDRTTSLVAARGLGLLRARLNEWDALRGQRVRSELGAGVARGVDDEGRLVVEGDDGARAAWSAGEVHLEPLSRSA
jgi:BirA family transcriptional regulator, biotin operon repressor / biotin---[acetyl-CoA-carboxylase] ligase